MKTINGSTRNDQINEIKKGNFYYAYELFLLDETSRKDISFNKFIDLMSTYIN